jgi:hypothetical protein
LLTLGKEGVLPTALESPLRKQSRLRRCELEFNDSCSAVLTWIASIKLNRQASLN